MKTVSIVVPLYNSAKFMPKLIDSLINQTYREIEIILVDDGSPDESGKIADNYSSIDRRIKVIHQKNAGTCVARNKGMEIATGEYLMFADGDDWLERDCVEYLVSLMEHNKAQMSMTDSVFTTRDRVQNEHDNIRVWNNTTAVAAIINTFYIPVGPWNKLYTSKIIRDNNINFSVAWFGEGLYFSTMAAQSCSRIAVGHRKVYNYRLNNPHSGTTEKKVINGINALKNILYIRDHLVVNSQDIQDALNWHICTNNYLLLSYIVNANAVNEYKVEYAECKKNLKHYLPLALKNKYLSNRQKLSLIADSLFPDQMAEHGEKKAKREFSKDRMK